MRWTNVPEQTQAFALICDDPDAPGGTFVHWVLYDLPPEINELPENVPPIETLENGAKQGKNDFKRIGYGGPCPPDGEHRYYFKLYALDKPTQLEPGASKAQVEDAMRDHILEETELLGRYAR